MKLRSVLRFLAAIVVINLTLGTAAAYYLAWWFCGCTSTFTSALLDGLIYGELNIPLALIAWISTFFGVHVPWVTLP